MKNTSVPVLEAHNLTVAYKKKPVLWNIDLSVPQGTLCAIIGPNGAGKSTFLKAALGIVKPLSGWVRFFGKSYLSERKRIAYVPQRESVDWDFPASVFDIALMGRYGKLGWFRRPSAEDKRVALESLKKVGMDQYKDRAIGDLSGGQQQRVFLARALAQDADVYFLDEPFSGVDVSTEKAIVQLLKDLGKQGKSVFVVHHDIQTVSEYFDWVIMLNVRLISSGPLKEAFTQKYLGEAYGGRLPILSAAQDLMDNA